MEELTKKCPMCAETIKLEAKVCRFCRAQFEIKANGYCGNCNEIREADENKCCIKCGSALMDLKYESKLVQTPSESQRTTQPPIFSTPEKQPRKIRKAWGLIAGFLVLITGACVIAAAFLFSNSSKFTPPTSTPSNTKTPIPTETSRPAPTLTPSPVEITFDAIGSHPKGSLVILTGLLTLFKSTWCDSECGLLLSEFSGSDNKITIFVSVAQEGVEPSPNQMKALPNNFGKWDVMIKLNDGTYAYIDNRITVTGKICNTTDGDPCISDIIKIELEK